VLDPCFNLTNKSNLIDDLIRFFDHLVSGLLFIGPPCRSFRRRSSKLMSQIPMAGHDSTRLVLSCPACFNMAFEEATVIACAGLVFYAVNVRALVWSPEWLCTVYIVFAL